MIPALLLAAAVQHFVIDAEHVLRPDEIADLARHGVEVQRVMPEHRYLVRAASADLLEGDVRIARVDSYGGNRKIARSAYHAAARGNAFTTVRLIFHTEVAFEDAQRAVGAVGGVIDRPLTYDFDGPHGFVARIPSTALTEIADDDRVFAVYGPPLHIKADNAVAASLSHVTPLFSAPYNLTGNGVVLSLFELAPADTTHPEFGGRLTSHITGSATGSDSRHPTHVSGTMIAAGIDPRAKGMSPGATAHEFHATGDPAVDLDTKQNSLTPLGVVADNNSWGYSLGWQQNTGSGPAEVWWGSDDLFGGYDGVYTGGFDSTARKTPVIFVHSAGNDGNEGLAPVAAPWFEHAHIDENTGDVLKNEIFCYSQNGSGTDCPAPTCSAGATHCEIVRHPTYGPFNTMGLTSSAKNVIAVGAVDSNGVIAYFSSRGPARDGRVKPDIVAKGVSQFSTVPGGFYTTMQGTSMSSPVITGMMGLFVEQWRKTFGGQTPDPETLKVLLIAGADDLGNPGPDYTYGFGLANAQASVDLIRADNNAQSRIRSGDIAQSQQVETTMAINAAQNVRVVLGWLDPDVFTSGSDTGAKTLVNDLDLKVIDPNGNAILPYVLDPANPDATATRGPNTVDNVEEVEIKNAPSGTYRVVVTGTTIATGPTQHYVLIANAPLGATVAVCSDIYEPNDTEATAYGPLASGQTIRAKTCATTDLDFYRINASAAGPLLIAITTTDTPIRVTLSGNGITPVIANVAANSSGSVGTSVTSPGTYIVKVEPTGVIGPNASYTLTPTYSFSIPARKRTARH